MNIQCQILADEEKHKIHAESIRILAEVGVKFLSDNTLKILKDSSAKVDHDTKIAKIPAEMVQQALKTAPQSIVG